MQLIRTTVRLHPSLKKAADTKALEQDVTFQTLITRALDIYLKQESQQKAKKLVFKDRNLGVALDQLSREDMYAD